MQPLGVGVVYWPGLEDVYKPSFDIIDVIEIEPQVFWRQNKALNPQHDRRPYCIDYEAFRLLCDIPKQKIIHGVGFPVGGTTKIDLGYLEKFIESIHILNARWASEHLSFNKFKIGRQQIDTGFFLPLKQTLSSVYKAVESVQAIQAHIPVPFAFETNVNYLKPEPNDLTDGDFFSMVANGANCGILLDIHNLWVNEQNGRESVLEVVEKLPLDKVWEVHIAGGQQYKGYWLDAHSGYISTEVMDVPKRSFQNYPTSRPLYLK